MSSTTAKRIRKESAAGAGPILGGSMSAASMVPSEAGEMEEGEPSSGRETIKRKSRNLSEKKRRDQFNLLVNELSSMVSGRARKMDKTTVLRATIAFLRKHNENCKQSQAHEIREHWKPSFLSNDEFTHLMLEAVNGYLMVISHSGTILYISEGITPLQSYLPNELINESFYDYVYPAEKLQIYQAFASHQIQPQDDTPDHEKDMNHLELNCHFRCKKTNSDDSELYDPVTISGHLRWAKTDSEKLSSGEEVYFCCIVRLQSPKLLREVLLRQESKQEFTSRHSLEWKFLFLDHRGPPIIGYLPFEVLGTSGYDYYHPEDLENVAKSHEQLMQMGEGLSCVYRFLTKGQQWIWLQTRYFITYHQWHSKPEFIVCVHKVLSHAEVMNAEKDREAEADGTDVENTAPQIKLQTSPASPSNSSVQSERINQRQDMSKDSDASQQLLSIEEDYHMSMQATLTSDQTNTLDDDLQLSMQTSFTSTHSHSINDDLNLNSQYDLLSQQQTHSLDDELNLDMQTSLLLPQTQGVSSELDQSMQSDLLSMIQPVASNTENRLNSSMSAVPPTSQSKIDLPTSIASGTIEITNEELSTLSSFQFSNSSLNFSSLLINSTNTMEDSGELVNQLSTDRNTNSSLETREEITCKSSPHSVVQSEPELVTSPHMSNEPDAQHAENAVSAGMSVDVLSPNDTGLFLTPIQWKLQEQLQQKHRQLKAAIMKQQSELQRVSQQLMLLQQHSPVLTSPDSSMMMLDAGDLDSSGNNFFGTVPTLQTSPAQVRSATETMAYRMPMLPDPVQAHLGSGPEHQIRYNVPPLSVSSFNPQISVTSSRLNSSMGMPTTSRGSKTGASSHLRPVQPQTVADTNFLFTDSVVNQSVFNPSVFLQQPQSDKNL